MKPKPAPDTASAADQQRGLTPWQKGVSGNPKGRVKGSRNKLSAAFIEALSDHFEEHGADAIHRVWKDQPAVYLKVIGATMPAKLETSLKVTNIFAELNLRDPLEFAAAWDIARKVVYGEAPMIDGPEDIELEQPEESDDDL
jgi:Family of unknown function (DUF5681)